MRSEHQQFLSCKMAKGKARVVQLSRQRPIDWYMLLKAGISAVLVVAQ
jgi:hypothetical protein